MQLQVLGLSTSVFLELLRNFQGPLTCRTSAKAAILWATAGINRFIVNLLKKALLYSL